MARRLAEHRVIDRLDVELTVRDANASPILRAAFQILHKELREDQLVFVGREGDTGRTLTLSILAEQLEEVPAAETDHDSLQERMRTAEDRVLARHSL